MAFKKIDALEKFNLVKEYWTKDNIALISKKSGISRTSLYTWIKQAENAVLKTFQQNRPGPQLQSLETENKILKEKLEILSNRCHNKSQENHLAQTEEILLSACPECGQNHWRKNGTTHTKKRGVAQRFSCQECSFSIFIALKKKT